ncbi:MAG: YfdX family protein [Epsilonproteobacteria bacterium]|nr:YfdX family protein [Campylobacterota bacterium]
MKKILSSVLVASLLVTSGFATNSKTISSDALKVAKKDAKSTSQMSVVQEAVEAVILTQKVLVDIAHNDKENAKKDIEKAIGKLEVVLAKKDAPVMLPIDYSVNAVEFQADVSTIKKTIDAVKDLLDDGKVQAARALLNTLQSEIDISTVNLPLASYPQALKLAASYLHDNKLKEAQDVLEMALSTLVHTTVVIPIPLITAEALIADAQKIAKKDKEQALKHLELAKKELKKAELLGYTSSSDVTYKILDDAIEKVEKEIKGKNKAEKLFEELINKFKSFKDNATTSSSK